MDTSVGQVTAGSVHVSVPPRRPVVPLSRPYTVQYRSGDRRTFRYASVFVIHYRTGDEAAFGHCRRDGPETYVYPVAAHG